MNDDYLRYSSSAKMGQAHDLIESNALLDLYIKLYKKKYRGEPVFPVSNAHLTQIRDFKRNAKDKAYELLQHFFEMKDQWFENQAYSLDCLLKNLHKISASYSSRTGHVQKGIMIEIKFFCDACGLEFKKTLPAQTDPTKHFARCEACEKKNAPQRRMPKEKIKLELKDVSEPEKEEKKKELLEKLFTNQDD